MLQRRFAGLVPVDVRAVLHQKRHQLFGARAKNGRPHVAVVGRADLDAGVHARRGRIITLAAGVS